MVRVEIMLPDIPNADDVRGVLRQVMIALAESVFNDGLGLQEGMSGVTLAGAQRRDGVLEPDLFRFSVELFTTDGE